MTSGNGAGARVLVTGHRGYIGTVLVPMLAARGYRVVGADTDFYHGCDLAAEPARIAELAADVRALEAADLEGLAAVVHLAALSNDPLGDLNPSVTYDINHAASVRLARLAREAGVPRFLFSSSCSSYGAAGDAPVDERSPVRPITAYAVSKVRVEEDVARLADSRFTPVFLRNATAYGASPRLRLDLVLNDLVAAAVVTGRIRVLSDGTPWRPLIHVADIAHAFAAMLEAPREAVHGQAFNIGRDGENHRVSDLAEMVREAVPGSRIEYAEGAGPDPRSYRVDFGKVARAVPGFAPSWTARQGVQEMAEAFRAARLTPADLDSSRFKRVKRVRELMAAGRVDGDLRVAGVPVAGRGASA